MNYEIGVLNFEAVGVTELGGQAELNWVNPTDINFAGVLIRRSSVTPPITIGEGVEVYNGTGERTIDTGLVNGQIYYYTIWAYSTNSEYSTDDNKRTDSVEVIKGQDGSGSPGSAVLIAGDTTAGYFGEIPMSELITGDALASKVGLSAGTSQFSDTAGWLKFAYKDKIQFVAKKPLRYNLSWGDINSANVVYGDKTLEIGGLTYKVRLMKGANKDPADAYNGSINHGSEWNKLMLSIHIQAKDKSWAYPGNVEHDVPYWGTDFTDEDLLTHKDYGNGSYSWCQEVTPSSNRLTRGGYGVSYSLDSVSSGVVSRCGWRPVLELVP